MSKIGLTNFILPRTCLDYHIFIKEIVLILTSSKSEVHNPGIYEYNVN